MAVVIYNSSGAIVGAYHSNVVVDLLEDQSSIELELTEQELDDIFNYTVQDGTLTPISNEVLTQRDADEKLTALRIERNRLLAETDWRFRSDLTVSQEWVDYCQALRDITNTYSSLDDVVWPTKPE